jgi:hypothetical protein
MTMVGDNAADVLDRKDAHRDILNHHKCRHVRYKCRYCFKHNTKYCYDRNAR